MSPRIGELFAGYGGLGRGVQAVLGGEIAWFSEFDPAPSKILAHHWPTVPNHGDITAIKWTPDCPYCGEPTAVYGPVDDTQYYCPDDGYLPDSIRDLDPEAFRIPKRVHVMTGGFPCQDVSLAGARAGLTETSRSGLWSEFARAIAALKPEMVVIENVRGLLSASAAGSVEPDPWGVGDGATRPVINALGAVLGDLASLGYDAEWCGVRAADAGAPHGRFRVFILAEPADSDGVRRGEGWAESAGWLGGSEVVFGGGLPDSTHDGHERGGRSRDGWPRSADSGEPTADSFSGEFQRQRISRIVGKPSRFDNGSESRARRNGSASSGSHQNAAHTEGERRTGRGQSRENVVEDGPKPAHAGASWGAYEPAIRRWESALGRVAPAPTNPDGRDGGQRLSARFVEWMMGLPEGHVTDVGLTRNEQLKALGNGVVPQQAELAIRALLARNAVAA